MSDELPPIGFLFIERCTAASGDTRNLDNHVLVQTGERTYRRATGRDLTALMHKHPEFIGALMGRRLWGRADEQIPD